MKLVNSNHLLCLLVTIGFLFQVEISVASQLNKELTKLDDQLEHIFSSQATRSYEQIRVSMANLEQIYSKDVRPDRTRFAHITSYIEKLDNEAAIRFGLDWLYYNEKMSSRPIQDGADYISPILGLIILNNPRIATIIYSDPDQFNKERISSLITYGIHAYNSMSQPPDIGADQLRDDMEYWPLRDIDRRLLENFLEKFI